MTTTSQDVANIIASRKRMEAMRTQIEALILDSIDSRISAPDQIVTILKSNPEGVRVVRRGFGGGIHSHTRTSLAEFCIKNNAVDVLQSILESGIPTLTPQSPCCINEHNGALLAEDGTECLHLTAIRYANPQALRLALNWDKKQLFIKQERLMGGMLHQSALSRVFQTGSPASAIDCCRLLLAEKAPFIFYGSSVGLASGAFFDRDEWGPLQAPDITKLLAEYITAGEIDLNEPPVGLKTAYEGMLPLRAAMGQGNVSGAVTCIDLGCDIGKAMAFECREQNDDIIKCVLNLTFENTSDNPFFGIKTPSEIRSHMLAGITAALMRRQLKIASSSIGCGITAANEPIRRLRMGL